jgi:primary-amine oxidase
VQEPEKGAVLAFLRGEGAAPPRTALAVLELTGEPYAVVEAVVDVEARPAAVASWREMVGVQPCLTIDDVVESEVRIKQNPQFRRLVRERFGITDMDLLAVDPWWVGGRAWVGGCARKGGGGTAWAAAAAAAHNAPCRAAVCAALPHGQLGTVS